MKWWEAPLGPGETAHHLVRVFSRDGARGIFISASGYTEAAIEQYRQALRQRVVFMMTLEEIVGLFNDDADFAELLKFKVTAAVVDKEPFKRKG
jgi:restriction system protein